MPQLARLIFLWSFAMENESAAVAVRLRLWEDMKRSNNTPSVIQKQVRGLQAELEMFFVQQQLFQNSCIVFAAATPFSCLSANIHPHSCLATICHLHSSKVNSTLS